MRRDSNLATRETRLAIADAIREFLDAAGQSRKILIGREPCRLSDSTVNKVFRGEFSERTLTMIEAMLGHSFRAGNAGAETATDGGEYLYDAVGSLQGNYFCARPLFATPTNLSASAIQIKWDGSKLVFEEHSSDCAKNSLKGSVHLPFGVPFMNLVSKDRGNVKTIILSLPDADGLCRGIISTLSNPRSATYIPVSAPIFLQRIEAGERPPLGVITPDDLAYAACQHKLASVTADEFGIFVNPFSPLERRRAFSVATLSNTA